jgi:preprotein translocase SecE subunit
MAVAEKPVAEKLAGSLEARLAKNSLLGGVFVLLSLWIVFGGLPELWKRLFHPLTSSGKVEDLLNPFLSSALLLLVEIGVIVGLFFIGRVLETPNPVHGLRAGIFMFCVFFFIIVWITDWIGSLLVQAQLEGAVGIFITAGVFLVLAFFASRFYRKPGFCRWLCRVEDNGWFHATSYKPNQGMRVRRGSMLALLVLGGCGIITSVSHHTWGREIVLSGIVVQANNWQIAIPFMESEADNGDILVGYIPVMFKIHYTMPVVLAILLLWVSWRVVNWPVFTDFLIATEAEMNKVSWTSRKRLVQDTVVVLVTVALLTFFLFVIDLIWIRVLSWDWIYVLRVDVRAEQLKATEKTQW